MHLRYPLLRLVLLFSLALGACSPRASEQPNILLITVDTLRADHLSSYGFPMETTPNMDALAKRGVVFERAIAAASTTAPAHASIMTSRYTRGHSIGFLNDGSRLDGGATLAEIFRDHGYRTAGFVGNMVLQRRNGFDRGFETYDDELPAPEPNRPQIRERGAKQTTERALAWIDTPSERPSFLWVHFQDPHGPYQPPAEFVGRFKVPAEQGEKSLSVVQNDLPWEAIPSYQSIEGLSRPSEYRGRYADEIFYADRWIGVLVPAFEKLGRPTIILLTADHGESLGEDGRYFMHGFATTPQLAHVPLILVAPRFAPARRVDVVHHVDVLPTLLDLADIEVPESSGISLAALARGERDVPDRIVYCDIGSEVSAYESERVVRVLGAMRAWQTPGVPVEEPLWYAYRWHRDDTWSRIRALEIPTLEIRRYLDSAEPMTRTELSRERMEELRALGYVVDGHGSDREASPGSSTLRNAERK